MASEKGSRKFGTRNVEIWPYVPIFWRFSRFFDFALFSENLNGEDDEEFLVLVRALRSANVFPYAVLLDVDLIDKMFVVFAQTNYCQRHFF